MANFWEKIGVATCRRARAFFGALLMCGVFLVPSTSFAENPACETVLKYTSCVSGRYLKYNGSCDSSSPHVGNECASCPSGCTCSGGTACPVCQTTVTITFRARNYTMTQTCTSGQSVTLKSRNYMSSPVFTTYGWSFDGWATAAGPTTAVYDDGESITCPSSNTTLYGVWSRTVDLYYYGSASATTLSNTERTQYYRNTSTTAASPTSVTSVPLYTNSTYDWAPLGWRYDSAPASSVDVSQTGTSTKSLTPPDDGEAAAYAFYSRTPQIAYDANGGEDSMSNSDCNSVQYYNAGGNATTDIECTLQDNGFPARSGYDFNGWRMGSPSGTHYDEGEEVTFPYSSWTSSKTYTAYADWVSTTVHCNAGYYLNASGSCTTCGNGYWCPGGDYTPNGSIQGRNDCPTRTDSNWTVYTTSTTASSWSACYETRTPSGCSSGTIKRAASSSSAYSSTTTVESALSANSNYYVDGTSCPACSSQNSGTYPYSVGGAIGYGYCYRACVASDVTGATEVASGGKRYSDNSGNTCAATSCATNRYLSSGSCPTCTSKNSTYPLSDGGSNGYTYCYRELTKTGSQVEPTLPTGCASQTTSACTPGTCTYRDYNGATDTTCTPTNCTKTRTAVSAEANYYVSGLTCPACSSQDDGEFPYSTGGTNGYAYCYRGCVASDVTGATEVASGGKRYSDNSGNTCAATSCATNRYLSSGSCPTCTSKNSTYPLSDGGSNGYTYCYRELTNTGSQVEPSLPTGCLSQTTSACTPGTCTYRDYNGATDTTCSPTNCTKTRTGVTANNGYYASSTATSCTACPSLTSGYEYVSGTGWTSYSNCKEQMRPTNCYSGYLTRTASNASTWGTATNNLTAKAGYKVSGSGNSATCSACGDGSYSANGETSCTACTTTSGWTTATGTTTATSYTACYQTQTPANCASGTIKRTASSISGTTITYGSATVTSALSSNAGYYVNGTACTICDNWTWYGGGTATSCNTCPTLTSGWTKASGTGWTSYSSCKETKTIDSCYTGYQTLTKTATSSSAWGTATGTLKAPKGYFVDGSGDSATCTACSGSTYQDTAGSTATSCKACPTVTSGWTLGTGSAWESYSSCFEYKKPDNCASGSVKHYASSASAWDSTLSVHSALSSNAGYYVNGTACTICANWTYYGGGTATSCNTCPTLTSGWTKASGTGWTSYSSCKETKSYSSISSNCYSGQLTKTAKSGTAWNTATSTLTAKAGYKVSGSGDSRTCSACGNGYYSSNGNGTSCNACSSLGGGLFTLTKTTTSTAANQCYLLTEAGSYLPLSADTSFTTCPAGSYCPGNIEVYYSLAPGGAITCAAPYSNSAAGSSSQNDCYLTTTEGNFVNVESAGETACTAGGYCTGGYDIYYGGTVSGRNTTGGRTACTTTSGWTTTSPAGSGAYTACYQTQTPANCASGTIKRTASSISGTTITYGSATVTSALSSNAGYYVNGTACSQCGAGTYYGGGTATSCTACTTTSGWTTTSPAGSGAYTACYQTQTPANCASGTIKRTASSISGTTITYGSATVTSALSSNAGYYVNGTACTICENGTFYGGGTATACTACPTLDSGYAYVSGTGWTAYSSCKEQMRPTNCYSGYLTKTASSATAWGTATNNLTAKGGYKVSGSGNSATCSACGNGYYSADGNDTTCDACPDATSTNWTVATTSTTATSYSACYETRNATNISSYCSAGVLKKTASSATAWGTASASTAFQAKAGSYVSGSGDSLSCTQCAIGSYTASAGTQTSCSVCGSGTTTSAAGQTSCNATCSNNNAYDNAWATPSWNNNSPTGLCKITNCKSGSYYTSTNSGNTNTCTACADGSFMASNAHTTTACTLCSSLTGVSPSGGTYSTGGSTGSTANTACQYLAPDKTITGCKTVTSQSVTYSGTAWPASTYGVTASKGYVIANNNKSNATCTACGNGTYQATDGSTATACTACSTTPGYPSGFTSGGTFSTSPTSAATASSACRYTPADISKPANCATVTTNTVSYSGSAWGTNFYTVTTTTGNYITANNTKSPTCAACSSLSGVSPSGGTYTTNPAANATANTACQYLAPDKTITGCKTVTSQSVTYSGTAWPASTYGVTASKGYVIANNNKSNATCTACTGATYQATDGATVTACSACPDQTSGWTRGTGTAWTAVTSCYETRTPADCASGTIKHNATNSTTWGSASVTTALTATANHYVSGTTCPTCSSGTSSKYTLSAAGTTSVNDCYLNTTATKYVGTAGNGEEACVANSYCPGGTKVYYGGTSSSTHLTTGGSTACASPYTKSATSSDDENDCYLTTTSTKYVASAGAGETACLAGGYCAGGSTIYKGGTVSGRNTTGGMTVCAANTWSNASAASCTACTTAKGYGNSGSNVTDHATIASCTVTCPGGQYVAAQAGGCVNVGAGNWCAGGTVAENATLSRTACSTGLTTIGYGAGADEAGDCGHKFHAGDGILYLRSTKKTNPSLNVKVGSTTFYGNMSTTEKNMSDGTTKKLKVKNSGTTYWVHDDSADGSLMDGYTRLEYIQSSGSQYINTGIAPTDETEAAIRLYSSGTSSWYVFGARNGSGGTILFAQSGAQSGSKVSASINGSSAVASTNGTDWNRSTDGASIYSIVLRTNNGSASYSITNETKNKSYSNTFSYTTLGSQTAKIGVLGYPGASNILSGTSRVYSFRLTQSGALVFNGVPCKRNSDNAVGLCDMVTNTFFGNVGSGSFVAGEL